jgi:hypothetical protein
MLIRIRIRPFTLMRMRIPLPKIIRIRDLNFPSDQDQEDPGSRQHTRVLREREEQAHVRKHPIAGAINCSVCL